LDGCTDDSETIVKKAVELQGAARGECSDVKILYAPNVFETKSNNLAIDHSSGTYVIIIQDDMIVNETGYNKRLSHPTKMCNVFAVTAQASHNYVINENSVQLRGAAAPRKPCWSDILIVSDIANKTNTPRDVFAVRNSVNRGPLLIHRAILNRLGNFDDLFEPQDMDDHDLCYRAYKEHRKICGYYNISYLSEHNWGGTRINGQPRPFVLLANQKNTLMVYQRHRELLTTNHNQDISMPYHGD
jgi:hypothetical protein